MKHIYLDKLFILFLIIIILTGNFNYFLPYFLLLLIHELSHAITGLILGYSLDKIIFYPYGGITKFNLPLNIPLKEELLILIMGPIMQIIGYFFLKPFFPSIRIYHYTLLFFNLLPIYPLDGGKILNIVCGYFINYLKSFYLTFIISLFCITLLIIYNIYHFNLNMCLMLIMLLIKLIDTYRKRYYYYHKFLLERYLYHFAFKDVRDIKSVKDFYRDKIHYIHNVPEKKYLKNYFENK